MAVSHVRKLDASLGRGSEFEQTTGRYRTNDAQMRYRLDAMNTSLPTIACCVFLGCAAAPNQTKIVLGLGINVGKKL